MDETGAFLSSCRASFFLSIFLSFVLSLRTSALSPKAGAAARRKKRGRVKRRGKNGTFRAYRQRFGGDGKGCEQEEKQG